MDDVGDVIFDADCPPSATATVAEAEAEEDIARTYDLGVNSFITKPVTFGGLLDAVRALNDYWLNSVQLPSQFKAA